MSLSHTVQRSGRKSPFTELLKAWRTRRRLSQLELALSSGVSQRHLSFLESGRAKPSRDMILQLCETLDVPLRERNDLLVAAGFAPMFRARPMDDPQMAQVMTAVRAMLGNHEPFPAIAVDAVGATWSNARNDTKGHSWRVLFVFICTLLPMTIVTMPLTFSIAHGIGIGFILYAGIKIVAGRIGDIKPVAGILALAFILKMAVG